MPVTLPFDHPAMLRDDPLFPSRVRSARHVDTCLKSGNHNPKIGSHWRKVWPGMAQYTLTLVERTTCPACPTRDNCYGNAMPSAIRLKPDRYLITKLTGELENLAAAHRRTGFSVRLHVLGDFFSTQYVKFWAAQVRKHAGLHVWGFTSWPRDQPIGRIIEAESRKWDRFKIRFSVERGPRSSTVMIAPPPGKHRAGYTCLYELAEPGKLTVKDCSNCGLCLTYPGPIVFKLH